MKVKVNQEISDWFYIVRFCAVISIICAHCIHIGNNTDVDYILFSKIYGSIGRLGVPLFFLCSGFFFDNKIPIGDFIIKKSKKIIVPWLWYGTIVWLYVVIRKGGISLTSWFTFVIYGDSHLWFMKTLFLCFFIALLIKKERLIYCIGFFSLATYLVDIYIIELSYCWLYDLNINIIWFFYFSMGYWLRRHLTLLHRMEELPLKYIIGLTLIWIGFFVFRTINGMEISDYAKLSTVTNLIGIIIVFYVAKMLCSYRKKIYMIEIGKTSFSIYLLHQIFAGMFSYLSNIKLFRIGLYFRPVVVLIITYSVIRLCRGIRCRL